MDLAQISAATVAVVAPFMPYLAEGGKKFAGKAGEAAWTKAQAIWDKIQAHFGNDPKIKGESLVVSADPQDKDSQARLAQALASRLKESPDLAYELVDLLGKKEVVQQAIAEQGSLVEHVQQYLENRGEQRVQAKDASKVSDVHQVIKR